MFKAKVYVTLKKSIFDPQGKVIEGTLDMLGYKDVKSVRVGKYMEIELDTADRSAAEAQISEISQKILSNPVIEDFRFELMEV